jgi:hypothetical protein
MLRRLSLSCGVPTKSSWVRGEGVRKELGLASRHPAGDGWVLLDLARRPACWVVRKTPAWRRMRRAPPTRAVDTTDERIEPRARWFGLALDGQSPFERGWPDCISVVMVGSRADDDGR